MDILYIHKPSQELKDLIQQKVGTWYGVENPHWIDNELHVDKYPVSVSGASSLNAYLEGVKDAYPNKTCKPIKFDPSQLPQAVPMKKSK